MATFDNGEKKLRNAFFAIIANSALTLTAPIIIGHIIDTYITQKDYHGVLVFSGILLLVYIGALITNYLQTKLMGTVGQHVLYSVRNKLFQRFNLYLLIFSIKTKQGI